MCHSARRAAFAAALLIAAPLAALAAPPPVQDGSGPQPFIATYSVAWHGIGAGTSTLELERGSAADQWVYTSTDKANGLFRLVFPHAIRQASHFRIADGKVIPLSFESSGAGQTVMVRFDWDIGRVTGIAKGKLLDRKLHPGTQDPLSVQIALMLALEAGHPPASFWMLDTDEIARFEYVRRKVTPLDTALGTLSTVLYTSHQHGSRRTTWLWLAPTLDYMPVRAEQRIDGSTQLSLEIRAFRRK